MVRILIVDDSTTFRQALLGILCTQFPSMEFCQVAGGGEALREIDLQRPDLIFMDINLPGENGLVLTKEIKAKYPEITIIIITNYDLPEYRTAACQCGADYFVAKGSSTGEEIIALVGSVIASAEG
ncbi:MAG: response regulator [Proteobacteria bacterium]|nr:response regulator [Pseudomonadota bacterium]